MKTAGFEEIEHTADWALRVWAPDLPGLLEQAARGMYSLSGLEFAEGQRVERELQVEAADNEGLLVNFLTELLHILDDRGLAFDDFRLIVSEHSVEAHLRGGKVKQRKKEIKAVTYHNLTVRKMPSGFSTEIVFDV
jgi:SHS2 domain-containing protein